MKLSNLVL